ncbi:MAG: precorrin-6y C5,15-methyltransferase (decarboxylating) subunit CbiE [Anaerolineae bacterium]
MAFRYESLEVWPLALEYVDACFIVADNLPQKVQFSIGDQLRRAATSIVANIAEGANKVTARSERNFYDIARGSVAETTGLLALCQRRGYLLSDRHERMYNRANVISAMLWGLIQANTDPKKVAETPAIYQVDHHFLDDILASSPLASPSTESSRLSLPPASLPIESSPPASPPPRLLIVGMSDAGADSLPPAILARIAAAEVLVGGRRHLGFFPEFTGQKLAITGEIDPLIPLLQQALVAGRRVVVLASGDPLCYGIGATLRRYFPAEALEIIPAPTAFQLAFAALAEPWMGAALLSAHARPLSDVVQGVLAAPMAAILTDNDHTPSVVAQALLDAALPADTPCAICENLGSPNQRIVRTILGSVGQESYAPLNVVVVWRGGEETKRRRGSEGVEESLSSSFILHPSSFPPGLPDDAFSTSAGQITKREIRLLALAELALGPDEVMWDIGAGSGSISIESGRAQPSAAIYAVEKRAEIYQHFQENLRRFPASNVHTILGAAPEALHGWPDPQAVFIGGSGQKLAEIVQTAQQRLQPGGRLVINLATLENLQLARSLLPEARVSQVQINRTVPIVDMLRFEALNPVFITVWHKRGEDR